jgi:multidrug efflux pump subunit AcrB
MTVLTSTLMSLLVSFTLVPWLTSRFAKSHRFEGKNIGGRLVLRFEAFLDWVSDGFVRMLKWALSSTRSRLTTLFVAIAMFGCSFWFVTSGMIGNAFFEPGERGEFLLQIDLPKNASLAQTDVATRQIEQWLLSQPEVVNTFSTVGTNNKSFGLNAPFVSEIMVFLTPYGESRTVTTALFARQTKIKLQEIIAGANITASPIDILGLSFAPIEVKLNGPDLDSLLALSERVGKVMGKVSGCVEISPTVEGGNPEVKVDVQHSRVILTQNTVTDRMNIRCAYRSMHSTAAVRKTLKMCRL